jgi:DNA-directed RNA polymerase beta subunit
VDILIIEELSMSGIIPNITPNEAYMSLPIVEKDEGFKLIQQFYDKTHFVNHQIDTYNDFITRGLQAIVRKEPPIEINNLRVEFNHVYVDNPKFIKKNKDHMDVSSKVEGSCIETTPDAETQKGIVNYVNTPLYPNEARKRNINYDGTIYTSLTVTNLETNKKTDYNQVPIGKLPIMLRSNVCRLSENNKEAQNECLNDFGGYFIIKGKERVLVGQLRRAYNKVYVDHTPEDKYKYMAEIRSMNEQGSSILIQLKINTNTKELFFSLPYIKAKSLLPAGLVFKALGISEDDMRRMVRIEPVCKENGDPEIEEIMDILVQQYKMEVTPDEAIESIANNISDDTKDCTYVQDILTKELFYHIGELTTEKSALHLGYMIKKLVNTVYNDRATDDKDNLANKRIDGTSSLLAFLFQILFKQFIKTVSNQMESKKNPNPVAIIKDIKTITHVMNQAFMTGNWNTQKSSLYTRVGVSQVLSMQNYGAKTSHLRRIMLPVGKKGKIPSARQLHASHFSFICPYETPEGDTVGLVSNLALSAQVSTYICPILTTDVIKKMKYFRDDIEGRLLVLVNGCIVGSADFGVQFVKEFNKYRLSDLLDSNISIIRLRIEKEIHIQTDEGRLLRPLFALGPRNTVLYKQSLDKSWDEHVKAGNIVFREVWELEQAVVAMTENDLMKNRYDYLEISPASTMMAVMASVIPLSNHSQSPRNAYQASMGKQAIGIPSTAYQERYDTTLHVLDIPQQPITKNEMVNVLKFNEMPHGANPIVAIMTYNGFNQEDSVILNKGSLDRGLFMSTTYKTIVEEEKKKGSSDFESICLPKFQYRNRNYDYTHLNEDGLVWKKNTYLKKGMVIIGRTTKKMVKKEDGTRIAEISDTSIVIKHGEEGYLDKVLNTFNNEGIRVIKVRIRIHRIPEIGDKFASSTAQKGTCGMIFPEEDMPFDKDGIKPDLIINPHAIPSRMTINMLIEMCFNLVGCKLGVYMDATPFKHRTIEEELIDWANRANIKTYATPMMDGRTGEWFPNDIFIAPCFYQRLKHMVADKIHARVAGPLDTLTHQPVAGRSRDGGLRFGEMEKDCMLSQGSTRVLKECLFDKSDKYTSPVCMSCGHVPNKRDFCDVCQESKIEMKNMPYAMKLLCQEVMGMGINLKIT